MECAEFERPVLSRVEIGKIECGSARFVVAVWWAMDTILLDPSGTQMKVRSVTTASVRVR